MATFVIADDQNRARDFAHRILRDMGQVVGLAKNGREAVDLCATLRPDVVLLDVSMPEMGGDVAARQILAAGTARFVVMATSARQDAILSSLRALGAHVVTKPFYETDLQREMRRIIGVS